MTHPPLVFVDIETNGKTARTGRAIEVAAIRYEHGEVTRTFTTLLNPGERIPYFITQLTGINDGDVAGAPRFADIADELYDICDGAVFVAHNVRFDFGFLKHEFMRVGKEFRPKMACTVRLSRTLYPTAGRHRLSDLIARHGLTFAERHRAYDDAFALVQFWCIVCQEFGENYAYKTLGAYGTQPSIPAYINKEDIRRLPRGAGVYFFEDEQGYPLYIGKSIHVRTRVLSHFARDTDEAKEFKISQAVRRIRAESTAGELSALLLESKLIKEYMPVYNRRLRRVKKLTVTEVILNDDGYLTLQLKEYTSTDIQSARTIVRMHPRRMAAKSSLLTTVRTFELCPKLCGLETGKGACFSYQLGKCKGACAGYEDAERYNARVMTAYKDKGVDEWPHDGAIVIIERGETMSVAFVVDKWIIQECVRFEHKQEPVREPYDGVFDLDAYQIIRSHLLRKPESVEVYPLAQFEVLYGS